MEYIIYESSDPTEVNQRLRLEVPARIGYVLRLKNGRSYKVVDFELVERADSSRGVRGALRRLA